MRMGMIDMAKKEKQSYPRSRKDMLRILQAAQKKGTLLETVLEEFAKHPFSMPALSGVSFFHPAGGLPE